MTTKRKLFSATVLAMAAIVGTSPAYSCGSRPGTPVDVSVGPAGPGKLAVTWRNRASELAIHWDIDITGKGAKGRTGVGARRTDGHSGPVMNSRHEFVFQRLDYAQKYCVRVRARDARDSCVSAQWSDWACGKPGWPTFGPKA